MYTAWAGIVAARLLYAIVHSCQSGIDGWYISPDREAALRDFATGLFSRLPTDCGVISDRRNLTNTPSQYHNESVLKKYQDRLKVGTLKESAKL